MSEFSERIKKLDNDGLAEVLAQANREVKRRLAAKLKPSDMSVWQYNEWAAEEIRKGEAAKSKSEAQETE